MFSSGTPSKETEWYIIVLDVLRHHVGCLALAIVLEPVAHNTALDEVFFSLRSPQLRFGLPDGETRLALQLARQLDHGSRDGCLRFRAGVSLDHRTLLSSEPCVIQQVAHKEPFTHGERRIKLMPI